MAELFNDVLGAETSVSDTATNETVETVQELNPDDATAEFFNSSQQAQPTEETPETESEEEISEDDESLTDEEKLLKELEKEAEDEKAPAFYRNKMKATLDSFNKFKEGLSTTTSTLQTELDTLKSSRVYEEQDLQRYKTAEEKVNTLSSIAATPEQIISTIGELNPRALPQVKQQLIWDAVRLPSGEPDYENLQALVDSFAGAEGKVSSKDVLKAIDALANGRVDPLDFDEYFNDEQRAVAERNRQYEQANADRQRILDEEIKATESRARQSVLDSQVGQWMSQVKTTAETLLSKFHLNDIDGDLPEAKEFKGDIKQKLTLAIAEAERNSPHFKELTTAIQLLSQPNKMTTVEAEREIQAYFTNPTVQSKLQAGLAEVNKAMERTILKEARLYKLLQKGLEASQLEKVNTARPLPKTAKDTQAKQLTSEQFSRLSAQEKKDLTLQAMSNEIRKQRQTTGSFG